MEIYVKKTLQGLVPANRNEEECLQDAKLKLNEYYKVKITKPRNYKFLQKFFVLLKLAFDNQEEFNNIEEFRSYVTMKAGFYKRIVTEKGEFYMPKSISFSKMSEPEFNEFYDRVFSFILTLLDCSNDDLLDALSEF